MKFQLRAAKAIIGRDVIDLLGGEVKRFGKRVLVVTGKNVSKTEFFKRALEGLSDIDYEVWRGVKPEPDVNVIEEGVEFAKNFNPDVFAAVGGGSVIDAAKLINLCLNGGELFDYIPPPIGKGIVAQELKPLVAVPTTFGTGSETTCAAVVKIPELGIKAGIVQECLLPKLAIVDGGIESPKHIAASAGMDALMHAIEAYTCKSFDEVETYFYSGSNPISNALAEKAIELIVKNFVPSINGDDNARMNMAIASHIAGIAFGNAGVHIPHAASHAIGGLSDAPHGVCVASVAPAVLEFISDCPKVKRISEIFGCKASEGVLRIMHEVGIPTLSKLGIGRDDIGTLVENTKKLKRLLVLSPKPVGDEELRLIFEKSLSY